MNYNFQPLTQFDRAALARLAALHRSVMHGLLSDLGVPLVLHYYEIAQAEKSVICLCAVNSEAEMLGWAMGSPAPQALNARLRYPLVWFASQMLAVGLRHPGLLLDLLQSLFTASDANLLAPSQIEMTYIGVAQQTRGTGLGRQLLEAFIASARQAGYTSVVLSVETDNPAAIALYTHHGFQITRTFHEGRFERHRMQFNL